MSVLPLHTLTLANLQVHLVIGGQTREMRAKIKFGTSISRRVRLLTSPHSNVIHSYAPIVTAAHMLRVCKEPSQSQVEVFATRPYGSLLNM